MALGKRLNNGSHAFNLNTLRPCNPESPAPRRVAAAEAVQALAQHVSEPEALAAAFEAAKDVLEGRAAGKLKQVREPECLNHPRSEAEELRAGGLKQASGRVRCCMMWFRV